MTGFREGRHRNSFRVVSLERRRLALAGLRERFPEASPEELRRRLATVLLGPELATKVDGPEPEPPTMSMLPPGFLTGITKTVDTVVLRAKLEEFLREESQT